MYRGDREILEEMLDEAKHPLTIPFTVTVMGITSLLKFLQLEQILVSTCKESCIDNDIYLEQILLGDC